MTRISQPRITAIIMLGAAAACGGGGGQPPEPPLPPPPVAAIQNGAFKDSNVSGLDFESGGQSGITDFAGRYRCETGSSVRFAIGAVDLGATACTTLSSPPALVGDGQLDHPEALNMARFLLALDGDEDPRNGIVISDALRTMAESWPAIDFSATDFDAEVTIPLSDIASVQQRIALLTPPALALEHLEETLSCAYSGAFVGQLAGDSTAAVTMQVGRAQFLGGVDDINWTAWDSEGGNRTTVFPYEISVPPTFDSTPADPRRRVQGTFDTPDSISGTWALPDENASGTYTAFRIGGNTAETRITGSFSSDDGGFGVLALDIDGDTLTGEAFEAVERIRYTVTGSLSGDDLQLQAVGGGETINGSGTVRRRDRNGLPQEVIGQLDIGGSFFGKGCKLN